MFPFHNGVGFTRMIGSLLSSALLRKMGVGYRNGGGRSGCEDIQGTLLGSEAWRPSKTVAVSVIEEASRYDWSSASPSLTVFENGLRGAN
jgi:hypothetical protein